MKSRTSQILVSALLSIFLGSAAIAADDSESKSEAEADAAPAADAPPKKPEQPDIFDFQGSAPSDDSAASSELSVDERILVKVEPIVRNAVVERIVESARIKVKTPPGFLRVDIYIEPVDAPFGGKSLAVPKMLGQAFGNGNFTLRWSSPERFEYFKIFALAHKNPSASVFSVSAGRSRAIDVAIGGNRLQPSLEPDLP